MTINTSLGTPIDRELLHNYFKRLVNHIFKILPMRENNEETLFSYIESLQLELLGCQSFISQLKVDPDYLTILSILQYLIDRPDCSIRQVKREVFHAISLCDNLQKRFLTEEVSP